MDCTIARDLLLTVEPAALRPGGDAPLAQHLATCAPCRAHAARLVSVMHALDRQHALLPAAIDAVIDRATAPAAQGPRVRTGRALFALPLAAAAAVLLYVFAPEPQPVQPAPALTLAAGMLPPPPAPPPTCVVNAPADRVIAVFSTADPRITIVWYF